MTRSSPEIRMTETAMSDFVPLDIRDGLLVDLAEDACPTRVYGWRTQALALEADATHYGMAVEDGGTLETEAGRFQLQTGMFFVAPGAARVQGGAGMVISRL